MAQIFKLGLPPTIDEEKLAELTENFTKVLSAQMVREDEIAAAASLNVWKEATLVFDLPRGYAVKIMRLDIAGDIPYNEDVQQVVTLHVGENNTTVVDLLSIMEELKVLAIWKQKHDGDLLVAGQSLQTKNYTRDFGLGTILPQNRIFARTLNRLLTVGGASADAIMVLAITIDYQIVKLTDQETENLMWKQI